MPLPPGLILNPATGELTGVPTVPGTYAIQLKVRDVLGSERDITDEVIINPYTPMSFSGNLGPMMATRTVTNNTVALAGGLGPYTYSIFSGSIPAGLSLNAGTGAITGAPNDPGGYAFTLRVVDSLAQIRDYVLAGTIAENLVAAFNGEARGTVSVPYSEEVDITGGTAPLSYSVGDGAIPAGLEFDMGVLSGTPTAPTTAPGTLRVTDVHGFTADTDTINFDIKPYPTLTGGVARGMVGKAYNQTGLVGAHGHTPYVFGAFGLPPGLSINPSTDAVTGTPTTPGVYPVTFTLTDDLLVQAVLETTIEIAPALTIGGAYTASVTRNLVYPTFSPIVSGGYMPRTFAISAGALPPGLSLNASNGVISGTPTTQGAYTATLRVTDADGSQATMAFDVTVAGDMTITGSVPNRGTTTVAFSGDNLGRTGGTAPYTWSVASGIMPLGLSLNSGTGDITGTPTTPGVYNYSIRVTDASGGFAQSAFTTTVAAYPTLAGTFPDASNGLAYNEGFAAAGGHAPLVWDISAGALPGGLSINAADGRVTGTPNANGTFNFTVRITDNAGNIATRAGTITTYAAPGLSTTLDSPTEEGLAGYSDGLSASGGKAPLAWSVEGTMPPGLSINSGTGLITGTIDTGIVTSGTSKVYAFTVRVTDALGRSATSSQSITVHKRVAHVAGPPPPTHATRTIAVTTNVDVQYGLAAYTFAIIGGALPTGLSMNAAGSITGTPTVNGVYNYTVRVTDSLGATADQAYSMTVVDPVVIAGTPGLGTVGVAYAFQPTVTGGLAPYEWFHVAGDLPPGCTINSSTGRVSGTPTSAGTFNYTIRVFSSNALSFDDHAVSTTVAAKPVLSLTYPRATVGESYSGTAGVTGGHNPKTFARVAGTFPPGLTLNASTGALTGTPTAIGTYTGTVRVTDAMGNIDDATYSIGVSNALNIAAVFANGTDGIAYSSTVGASGGYAPYSWSLVSGAIPTGTTRTNGTISGTPNTPATYNFTLRITDADGHTFDKAFSIVIGSVGFTLAASPNPASDYALSGGFNVTVSASSTVTPTGGIAPFSYAWALIAATGSAGNFTATASPANKINCSRTGSTNYLRTETWRCTVTDNAGTIRTINVVVELEIEADTGGGSGCPDVNCVLPDGRRVGDLKVGDIVECVDVVTGERFMRHVRNITFSMQPCMTLRMAGGGTITQSESTRMVLRDGTEVTTPEMLLEEVLNYNGGFEQVLGLKQVGERLCANVDLGNVMFFCGDADGAVFATHNAKMP